MAPPPAAPPAKKTSPLVWILVGCGGLILICGIAAAVVVYWGAHKIKGYAQQAQKNPAVFAAKMAAAANPDLEVVSSDDDSGTVTIRNKKTGETLTMNAEDIKKGRLSFKDEKGKEVVFDAHTKPGKEGLTISSNDGSMSFGSGSEAEIPGWVPRYPGAEVQATHLAKNGSEVNGGFMAKPSEAPAEVAAYFEKELKSKGFAVQRSSFEQDGKMTVILAGTADGGNRTVNVTVATGEESGSQVHVIYGTK
jgi:hypothetical protein